MFLVKWRFGRNWAEFARCRRPLASPSVTRRRPGWRRREDPKCGIRLASRTLVAGQEGLCAFCDLTLVCTWAISGLAAVGIAAWFGFDIGTALGAAG